MKMRGFAGVLLVATCLMLWTSQALSQATITFAQLNGTVQDESGRVVAKASISLREMETNRSYNASTSGNGFYLVPNLPPGHYELTASSPGFGKFTQTGIALSVGQTATINVRLKVAAAGETVTVTTEAPTVEATRTEISQVIDTQQIQSLPVSGRLFTDYALLTPGVATGR
ncbi:MAG TPA: carboxypeptidase-like regulatory domain-containing protein, partial [Terriglobales bacterium]